jgi:hypothetical protein
MVTKMISWIRGEVPPQDDVPVCPEHDVPMDLYKKLGKAARYADQETQTYTLIFKCPVPGCGESAERTRVRNQIPVPGERTTRPPWATRDRKGL